jgi:hypothetical protein
MATYRVVHGSIYHGEKADGWYVERVTDDGKTTVVTPFYLRRREAQEEAQRLIELEPDPNI